MAYTPPTYSPSSSVKSLHGTPRVVGNSQFPGFENLTDSNNKEAQDYLVGIAIILVSFVVVGILLWIGLGCYRCCCYKYGCCKRKPPTGKNVRLGFIFCVSVMVIGAILGYVGNGEMTSGITGFGNGAGDIADVFDNVANEVSTTNGQAVSQKIIDSLQGVDANCAQSKTADAQTAMTDTKKAMADLVDSVGTVTKDMRKFKDDTASIDKMRSQFTLIGLLVSTAIFVIGFIHIGCLMAKENFIKPLYYFVLIAGSIVMLLAWILAGVNLSVGTLVADICMNPVGSLSDGLEGESRDELVHLFYCNISDVASQKALDEVVIESNKAVDDIKAIKKDLEDVGCNPGDAAKSAKAVEFIDQTIDETVTLLKHVGNIRAFLGCANTNPIMTKVLYTNICTDIPNGTGLSFACFLLIGLFGFVSLCIMGPDEKEQGAEDFYDKEDGDDGVAKGGEGGVEMDNGRTGTTNQY